MYFETYGLIAPNYGEHKYYKNFYKQYCYNMKYNIIFRDSLEINDNSLKDLGEVISNSVSEEETRMRFFMFAAGLMPPNMRYTVERTFYDFDDEINEKHFENNKDKFLNHITDVHQLITIYSIFESGIIEYCNDKNHEINGGQRKLLKNLISQVLEEEEFITVFNKLHKTYFSLDEIFTLWNYYTNVRNLYAHANGIISIRFIEDMEKIKEKISKIEIEHFSSLDLLLDKEDIVTFNIDNLEKNSIFSLSEFGIRVFRNFLISIWETIYLIDIDRVDLIESDRDPLLL